MITESAGDADIALPLIDACHGLYAKAQELESDGADVISVIRAYEDFDPG